MNKSPLLFLRLMSSDGGMRQGTLKVLEDEVHVWGFSLDADEGALMSVSHWLSSEERERATRFASPRHRQEFTAAHSALRLVLSRYCDQRPEELGFHKSASGKPFLPSHAADSEPVRFNLTHSHGRALVAVARGREVGVDLEKIRPEVNVLNLARRFLSRQDLAFVESAEPSQRHERFLQVWVAREAVAKAEGTGLMFPLNRDHVDIQKDGKKGRLIRQGDRNVREVSVQFIPLETGWVGAVAAEGTNWALTLCEG